LALPLLPRLDDYLSHHARHTPAAPACWFMDGWTSYSDLEQRVDAMARALHGLGLRHGDRLAVLSTPRPEFWVSLLAALRIGVVWVGLNPRYTWRELAHVVGDSQPRALLSLAGFEGVDFAEMAQRMRAEFPFIGHAFRLDDGPALGGLEPAAALQERAVGPPGMAAYAARRGAVKGADAAVIVYTSGSSGTPKGAVLPHRSLVYGPRVQAEQNAIARPRVLCNFPINHVACIGDTCASTLIAGGMLAFDERFDPGHYLKLVERLRLTQLAHVPTVLQMLLAHPDFATRELSSLQLVAWGGAALPISAIRAFRARGLRMISIYGMTETVCNVTWADERSSDEVLATTIGRPDPNVALKLVDEQCAEVPEGEQGEIAVRHEALMLGYFNRRPLPRSHPKASCAPAIWRCACPTATTVSSVGAARCTSPAATTSIPAKSRFVLKNTLPWRWLPWWACPTRSTRRLAWRGSAPGRARRLWMPTRCAPGAGSAWPTTRFPSALNGGSNCHCCQSGRWTSRR
jgi:acyl-CoA synthetase (AMP-forming)/AMP-acid ligase II